MVSASECDKEVKSILNQQRQRTPSADIAPIYSPISGQSTGCNLNSASKSTCSSHRANKSLIERTKKNVKIYIPVQWYSLIASAKIDGHPDVAKEVTFSISSSSSTTLTGTNMTRIVKLLGQR
jgi:hypothetical protein